MYIQKFYNHLADSDAGLNPIQHPSWPWSEILIDGLNYGITLTPTWISNHIHYEVWDEIAYPLPNRWTLGMGK